MNLVIDIGNSRTKFSVFDQRIEVYSSTGDELLPVHIIALLKKFPLIKKVIVSTVKNFPPELKSYLSENFNHFLELNEGTPLPLENKYLTKNTLGNDRLAAAVGAAYIYPNSNILVIDAGTALTYDIVTETNLYMGGNISPGIEMRYKALHQFTGRLPLVEFREFIGLFGQSTHDAIHAGVQNGIINEVDCTINSFKEIYKNLYVIITGGNANFFDKKLKNSFFVHYNLVAIGLNRILEHNGEI